MTEKGIVIKTVGGFFFVADQERHILQLEIRGRIQNEVYPGDKVVFSREKGVIEELLTRENLLFRPQVANVEKILVVHSFDRPSLDKKQLDKYLLMVEACSLPAVIVLNKSDLLTDKEPAEICKEYRKIGYPVFITSVNKNKNIESLYQEIKNDFNVLAGPSGTGKSSLINLMVPEADRKTKPVSENLEQGVHTTRQVELLPLGEKGWVADTPGFSVLEFEDILPRELPFLYPEFNDYLNDCKFNMCSHTHEPGCAVKQALQKGKISQTRYSNYTDFYQELKKKEEQKYD